jgi:hypothetical protein
LILCLFTTYGLFGATPTSPLHNSDQPHCEKVVTGHFLGVPLRTETITTPNTVKKTYYWGPIKIGDSSKTNYSSDENHRHQVVVNTSTENNLTISFKDTNAQPVKKPISLLKATLFVALYYAAYKASGEIKDLGTTNGWPLVPTIFGITEAYTGLLALLSGIALPFNAYDKIHETIDKKID